MIIDFGNATFATVEASYNVLASRMPLMQFWGERGAPTAPQMIGSETGIWCQGDQEWELTDIPPTAYDRLELAAGLPHWLDCICGRTQPINGGRHGRHVLDILLSSRISACTERAVELATTF